MNDLIELSLKKLQSKKILNPELDLRLLINYTKNIKKEIFLSCFEEKQINKKKFNQYLERRLNCEPISKIINKKNFWKYEFYVNENVLDPRPETEFIIEESLKFIKNKKKHINILDIGTGSGCLSIALAKEFVNSKILAIDVSKKAILIAKKNIKKYKCNKQIKTKVLSFNKISSNFDLIVSNPPYLSKIEYSKIGKNIKNFEPKIALFGGDDGLTFYRAFAKKLPMIMKKNSLLILEIGDKQSSKCQQIFKNSGLKLNKITKDLQKKDRILVFSKL